VKRVAATALLVVVVDTAVVLWFSPDSDSGRSPGIGLVARNALADLRSDHQRAIASSSVAGPAAIVPINQVLAYTPAVGVGSSRRRDIALTFDDGPGPYTNQVLAVLRRTHTPATFFAIGEWARRYPRLIRAELSAGAEVGDHTETHPLMSVLSPVQQRAQIVEAAAAIQQAGAPSPHLWRPPYGAFNATTLSVLRSMRMLLVLWTVDTSDYARPGVARIVCTAVTDAKPGAIILMHDGGGNRSQTVAALPRIISTLRQRHYRLVTVSQLLADDPPPHSRRATRAPRGSESGGRPRGPKRR
jgi:peptidoglycan/xylan/chitin deacetylase (PgdA/CDA1 family)